MQKQIFKPRIYEVKSESDPTKSYFVSHTRPTKWSCTCKDWLYRSKDESGFSTGHKCKHIKKVVAYEGL